MKNHVLHFIAVTLLASGIAGCSSAPAPDDAEIVGENLASSPIFAGSCSASCTCTGSSSMTSCMLADGVTRSTCGAFGLTYAGSPQCNPVCGDHFCATTESNCTCPSDCATAPLACLKGDATGTQTSADNNVCVPDVMAAVNALPVMGTHIAYFTDNSPPVSYPIPTDNHWQGIARLHGANSQYFVTSRSFNGELGKRDTPSFSVGRLGSITTRGKIGTNLAGGLSPTDIIVKTMNAPLVPPFNSWGFIHTGGIQALGDVLVVPHQDQLANVSQLTFYNVSNPLNPTFIQALNTTAQARGNAGAASLAKLADGRFMVMLVNTTRIDLWISQSKSLTSTTAWTYMDTRCEPSPNPIENATPQCAPSAADPTGLAWQDNQNFQLVTQCDGRIFAIGTYNTMATPPGGTDYVDVWQIGNSGGNRMSMKLMTILGKDCDQWCDFAAGGGPYVDPAGHLVLYGVVHAGATFAPSWVQAMEFAN